VTFNLAAVSGAQVWTNSRYMPTAHRVINKHPTQSRVSIPFFYEPCFDAIVSPIPQIAGWPGAVLPTVRYGKHLESKVLHNFEL
jgi:isopenicillin N synthase-like dioxygenase